MSAPTFQSTQVPRGELFADSGAAAVWAAIQHLSEESKRVLLDAFIAEQLVPDLRATAPQVRSARALTALREAHQMLLDEAEPNDTAAESPRLSVESYRRLHALHGARLAWPPDGTIRRCLAGTWNDCLRAAGLELVPDGDALVREIGGALTREECLAAVRAYARETHEEIPTFSGYLRWANKPDVRRRPGRRPRSQGPIDRLFGDWAEVLVQAGIAQADDADAGRRDTSRTDSGGRTVYLRSRFGYSDEQLRGAVREIADRLGHPPTTQEYRSERDKLLVEEARAGKLSRSFPSLSMLQKRFATWNDVLRYADLEPGPGRHRRGRYPQRRSGRALTPEQIIAALRESYLAIGDPFTQPAYSTWRRQQQARDRAERRLRQIPSYTAVWTHFGTWQQACMTAFDGWDPTAEAARDSAPDP